MTTATTPGSAAAALTSMPRIRACALVLRRIAMWHKPGDVVVGEIAAPAAREPGVLPPFDALADHSVVPATSSTASTMPA